MAAGALIHAWWVHVDDGALYWDAGRHAENARWAHGVLTAPIPAWDRAALLYLGPEGYYPPVYSVVAACVLALLGVDADVLPLTGIPFLWLLMASGAWLARRLGGPWSAAVAPWMFLGAPIVFDLTHQVMLDLPLTAMTAAYLCVLCARPFHHPRRAALLGVLGGAATLTKWTFLAFGIPAALVTLAGITPWQTLRSNPRAPALWRKVRLAASSVLWGLAVALPWFLEHRRVLFATKEAGSHVPGLTGFSPAELARRFGTYASYAWDRQLDVVGAAWALAAVAAAAWLLGRKRREARVLLATAAASALVWGVLGKHQDGRYSMPQLAAWIPLMAWLPTAVSRRWQPLLRVGAVGWCAWSILNICLAPPLFSSWGRVAAQRGHLSGPPFSSFSESPLRDAVHLAAQLGWQRLSFERDRDIPGVDELAMRAYAALEGVHVVSSGADGMLRLSPAPSPQGALAWEVPGEPGVLLTLSPHGERTSFARVRASPWSGNTLNLPLTCLPHDPWVVTLEPPTLRGESPPQLRTLVCGPHLTVPAGDYVARVRVASSVPLPQGAVEVMVNAPGHRTVGTPRDGQVDIPFTLFRARRGLEVVVQVSLPAGAEAHLEAFSLVVEDASTRRALIHLQPSLR